VTSSTTDLPIDNAPINIGNAWSSSRATIPASAPGIYYIVYSGVQQSTDGINVSLCINGNVVSTVALSNNPASTVYR
jgi:hypothetical protein